MNESANRALLPAGLRDILPPAAELEAKVVGRLAKHFAAHGYERVKPPMIEFEDSLLAGGGAAMAPHSFRLMDPVSQRMLAVRADMTLQVARIAETRLARAPRPLRLSYAGQVLRVRGTQLRPDRQFGQTGIELIGVDNAEADAEAIVLPAGALMAQGMKGVSVDLSLPALVPLACRLPPSGSVPEALSEALNRKDVAAVRSAAAAAGVSSAADLLVTLIAAAGPAEDALAKIAKLALPAGIAPEITRLREVVTLVRAALPELALTVDPVEHRGLAYHTGVSFTIFSKHPALELGRGGRYIAGGNGAAGEPATGATLFTDTILEAMPIPAGTKRIYLPYGSAREAGARLRADGWVTVAGLAPVADARAEAKRLGCGFALAGGKPIPAE